MINISYSMRCTNCNSYDAPHKAETIENLISENALVGWSRRIVPSGSVWEICPRCLPKFAECPVFVDFFGDAETAPVGAMSDERWEFVSTSDREELTLEEIGHGWHFCNDFDGLLVGPGMSEREHCHCFEDAA